MTESAYCDLCDLPLAHCVHGMPPPPPPAPKAKPAPRAAAPKAPRKATTGSAASSTSGVTVRRTGTTRTPQREFRQPILDALAASGGEDHMDEVLAEVERRMAPVLREGDLETVERGEPRWRKAARFERKAMVDDGLLTPLQRPGVWTLTPEGRALAQG
jgi:hypothetical protein